MTKAKIHSSVYANFFHVIAHFEEYFSLENALHQSWKNHHSLSLIFFLLYLKFFTEQIDIEIGRGNMKTPAEGLSLASCLCMNKSRKS